MAADCVFIAENINRVAPQDILKDFSDGIFPRSTQHYSEPVDPEVCEGFLIIPDCCRKHLDGDYQKRVIEYLEHKCGGKAGVWGDFWTHQEIADWAKNDSNAWPELKNITAID